MARPETHGPLERLLLGTLLSNRTRMAQGMESAMTYQYRGSLSIEQELAAAEEAKEEARQRIQERRSQLRQLREARKALEDMTEIEDRLSREIHKLTLAKPSLPEPIYGGRSGLKAADEEIRQYNRSRNSRTRPPLGATA